MIELTKKQERIYVYLKNNPGSTPTEIGKQLEGENYENASAWACSGLKSLVNKGAVEKTRRGSYGVVSN